MKLEEVEKEFNRCWPWLEASLEYAAFKHNGTVWPTHRKEHVWERIVSGKCHFWPGKECAIITEFYVSPTGLKSHHTWLTGANRGRGLREIKKMMPAIEEWGKKHGAHRQTGSGRYGWLRVFSGYRIVGYRKEKSLLDD